MNDLGKLRILVIEDDPDLRRILRFQLEAENIVVETAEDGQAALGMIGGAPWDCILLDLMMPGMDGFTVLKRLRFNASTAETPVIILTASHDERHRMRGSQYMADAFLNKPYDLVELTEAIRRLCAGEEATPQQP